ncbi:hypothetical protein LPJ60_003010 [Coemansia sp. RSA 2675]|nr:hypothetical protein LPJ60_003010 [Coemansia sp. RSA 2675]
MLLIVPDKAGNRGWLEQRLTEERQTSGANGRRSQARQVGYKSRRAPGESEGDAGFVKIERGKRAAETRGSKSSSKSQSGDAGDESEMTLTAKDLAAKAKWQQSGAAKSRMQDRLRDPSLAVWQRRKIELKLKLGSDKWEPEKKIATSSMEKIRLLNSEFPDVWTMQRLSEQFKVSQETVRRILKSKFRPSEQRTEKRELKRRSEMLAFKEKEKVPGDRTQNFASSAIIDQLTHVLNALSAEDRKKEINKTKAVYAFEVANAGGKKHYFVVDLKQAGKVTDGATEAKAAQGQPKPDISIAISDDIFVKISEGKTTAASEFMSGKVKIKGNMMLGMKLEPILKRFKSLAETLPPPPSPVAATAAAASTSEGPKQDIVVKGYNGSLVIAQILKAFGSDDAKREAALKKTNAIFQIDLNGPEGIKSWVLNLKPGASATDIVMSGTAAQNKKAAGATLILNDADFVDLASGKLTGQSAFMGGKLKSKGNIMLALKLESVLKAVKGPVAKL